MEGQRPTIERIARYLAGRPGASGTWPAFIDDAASLLALIQQPDDAMAQAGDVDIWIAMIDAALRDRWTLPQALDTPSRPPASSHDEEGEAPLAPRDVHRDDAAWASIKEKENSA